MEPEIFDYIVVGSGSSGAVVASRLAEDRTCSVLLLEAGQARQNDFWVKVPIGIGKILQDETYVWPSQTSPQSGLAGQHIYWPHGRIVGGSSSVNGMLHVRGEAAEYDHWRKLGNTGWGFDELLPYFKRLESAASDASGLRGDQGPIRVTDLSKKPDALSEAFIAACEGTGIARNPDYNGASYAGVGYLQMSVDRGRRCGTAAGYLKSQPSNLDIRTAAQAKRILFERNRAVGIAYEGRGGTHEARCRAEVLVCCGPIKSPQLLELSGIGDGDRLASFGIRVVHHAPGVGENLCDHLQSRINFECTQPITLNDRLNSRLRTLAMGAGYLLTRSGFMARSGANVHALVPVDPGDARPAVKIQLHHLSARDRYAVKSGSGLDPHSGFSIGFFQLRPASRGRIHIQSPDVNTDPLIDPAYLDVEGDAQTLIKAFKLARTISQNPALVPFVVRESLPGNAVASDDEILAYLKESGQTSWHPIGTCHMGSEAKAVVTPELRVRGVDGLRVIDSSVMPTMASSNTNIPSIMIGEKGADLVRAAARP